MTVRHVLLTVAALAVLGLGVYLFLEVRAEPATADAPARPDRTVAVTTEPGENDEPAEPPHDATPAAVRDARGPADASSPGSTTEPTITAKPPTNGTEIQKLDAIMSEASKAYDHGEFEDSKTIAARVLATEPTNVRMLRIMVSASCIDGDNAEAQKHYLLLPAPDREQMKIRCSRYGVTFTE